MGCQNSSLRTRRSHYHPEPTSRLLCTRLYVHFSCFIQNKDPPLLSGSIPPYCPPPFRPFRFSPIYLSPFPQTVPSWTISTRLLCFSATPHRSRSPFSFSSFRCRFLWSQRLMIFFNLIGCGTYSLEKTGFCIMKYKTRPIRQRLRVQRMDLSLARRPSNPEWN